MLTTAQNIAAPALEILPSLTNTLPLPGRLLGRRPELRYDARTSFITRETLQLTPKRHSHTDTNLTAVVNEHFGNISLDRLTAHYSPKALNSIYGTASLFPSVGWTPPSSFSGNSRVARSFSTATLFGLRSTHLSPRQNYVPRTHLRFASNAQSSHNLLAHMEATANNNPGSASAQNAFYSALLRANMPEILAERYETGRYATNAACDAMYHRALDRMGSANTVGANNMAGASKGLSQEQINSVTRAVVANGRGGNTATARHSGSPTETGERSNPVHVVVQESMGMTIFRIGRFILIGGAVFYFALVIMSFFIDAFGLLRRNGGPQNTEVKPEQQKARFSDVKGCDEAKEEMQEIVDFLRSPDKYNQLGGKLPKGVLMVGPPGTGKTLLARAVAGEAGVPFFYMSGSEFDEVYVGVGAKRVRELFQNAKSKAPAIVFIDELDAVGGKRNERDAAYHMQTLNQMLTELDGFDQTAGVVFIAATNFPQMLDKALTRPGRFDRQVHVDLPDVRGRVDILKHYLRDMQIATEVDASLLARGTPGFSGADLENLVNQAAVHASKIGHSKVDMKDLEWAKDRVIMGAEKKSMVVQEADKLATAYHEAGHALMALFTEGSHPLYKVTIIPRARSLGLTSTLPEMDMVSYTKTQLEASIDRAMGGKIAEEVIYGADGVTTGCSSDLSSATDTAYAMVMYYGMSEKLGSVAYDGKLYETLSHSTKMQIEDEVRRILRESEERARKLITGRRRDLEIITRGLMKYETLNKDEVDKLLRGESLPEDEKPSGSSGAPLKLPELPTPHIPIPTIPSASSGSSTEGTDAGGQAAGS